MKLFHDLRRLYSLDTLDARFTNSKCTLAVQAEASTSKWRTLEFYVYYVVFIVAVPQMFKVSYDVSKDNHPNYPKFAPLLSVGWIPGRKVDNSDSQYAGFRDNVPYMLLLLILHPCLRRGYNAILPVKESPKPSSSQSSKVNGDIAPFSASTAANARLEQRLSFDLYFALIFLCALHGFSAIKILLILYMNFLLATRLPKKYVPAATWIFNLGILFANELCRGYNFGIVAGMLQPTLSDNSAEKPSNWGTWLDSHGGLIPRWEILFNITVLRLISFNLDHYWSLDYNSASAIEVTSFSSPVRVPISLVVLTCQKKQLDHSTLSERDRVALPAPPSAYTLRNYLSYTLYSPLYLTGPILTFNDYIFQSRYPVSSVTRRRTSLYAIRFFLALLCMEIVIHYIYTVAISKSNPTWTMYSPFQLSMLGYFHLHHIWLKLLLPWRFFRLWALIDGIDPPENMVRCMSNNYSALAFWRGWHRSFNRWIVRYIYIPLGGSGSSPRPSPSPTPSQSSISKSSSQIKPKRSSVLSKLRPIVNLLIVFTFVALWHDINATLIYWSWLITLFILPEALLTLGFPARNFTTRPTFYRILCGVGAVFNILMMMAANLVGFAVGLDGLQQLVRGIVGSWWGLGFLGIAGGALFVGVQVMFEIREDEARQGIRMKC